MTSLSLLLVFFCLSSIATNICAFRCETGLVISDWKFCNRHNDCGAGDRSDELFGCNRRGCGTASFMCQSDRTCVHIQTRCDGVNDCSDGSDEWNCGDQPEVQINPQDCRLDQGKFLCKNKLACIDFALACDNRAHCRDNSDESPVNCGKLDSESCKSCPQYCLPTPDGPTCICNSANYESSPLCREIQNCSGSSELNCDQYCIKYRNFAACLCHEGHHEVTDTNDGKKSCRNDFWLNTVLLYTTVTRVRTFNFTDNKITSVQWDARCSALTASRDQVYCAEYRDKKAAIRRASIHGGEIFEEIINLDSRVTSVSIDWVTENIYFTNSLKALYVCSREGAICTELNCCGINNVVLVPKRGIMFYSQNVISEETDQFIMKSNMDGSEADSLLYDESFLFPVSIATDEYKDRIYWLEVKQRKLHSASFDGTNKKVEALGEESFSYFSVLEETFFFAGNRGNLFYSTKSFPIQNNTKKYQDDSTSFMRNLYVYNPVLHLTYQTANPCANASCVGLCLTRPLANGKNLDSSCLCENFVVTNDDHWCIKTEKYSRPALPSSSNEPIISVSDETSASSSTQGYSESTEYETTSSALTVTLIEPTTNHPSISVDEVDVWSRPAEPTSSNNSSTKPRNERWPGMPRYLQLLMGLIIRHLAADINVVYSTATKIKIWNLLNNTHRVVQSGVDSTALTGVRGDVYYASIDDQSHIFKTHIESGLTKEILRLNTQITSIAVDWITNNVYFTTNGSLSVCSQDGEICTRLKCCGIDQMTVAPEFQWMFYVKKMNSDDTHLIVRCGLDGTEETVMLDESFQQIFSLTADEYTEKIYWFTKDDGLNLLHSISFSGNKKNVSNEKFVRMHTKYTRMSILANNLFYVSRDNSIIWQKFNWSFPFDDSGSNHIRFLQAFSPSLQKADGIKDPCKWSSCHGLCLLSPSSSTNESSFTCVCQDFEPTYENHWCDKNHPNSELKLHTVRKTSPEPISSTSTEPAMNFPASNAQKSNRHLADSSVMVTSMESLQHGYTVASGVGFLLGVVTASLVIAATCFVYQKFGGSKDRKNYLVRAGHDDIEL